MDETRDLLALVAETLRTELVPALHGAPAYRARIAASLVDTVSREIASGPVTDDPTLAAALRDGEANIDDPAVAAALWQVALARRAIDQPSYDTLSPRA